MAVYDILGYLTGGGIEKNFPQGIDQKIENT